MKKGAPIAEVTTPIGNCAGEIIVLDIKSATTNINAPSKHEPGIKYL